MERAGIAATKMKKQKQKQKKQKQKGNAAENNREAVTVKQVAPARIKSKDMEMRKPTSGRNDTSSNKKKKTKKKQAKGQASSVDRSSVEASKTMRRRDHKRDGKTSSVDDDDDDDHGASQSPDPMDIDAIFSTAAKLKKDQQQKKEEEEAAARLLARAERIRQKAMAAQRQDADGFGDAKGERTAGRKMVDGLRVYTYDELGVTAESGGTPDCPFDCDCCF